MERLQCEQIGNVLEKATEERVERCKLIQRLFQSTYMEELKAIYKLTFPVVMTQFFQFLIGPVALMFSGHLGTLPLAGVALANSFINITGLTIAIGFACACDTLFAQTYGSTNKKKLGIVLQRSIMLHLLAVFPCWALHLNMDSLFGLFGQDPQVTRIAARYMLIFMPAVPNILLPNVVIGAFVNICNAALQYVFVYVAGLGVDGSAIAQVITYFLLMSLTLLYIRVSKVYIETWHGFSTESLLEWGEFVSLGVFGLIMFSLSVWSYEIGILLAGLIGPEYLGAMSVIFQLAVLTFMIPFGIGIAASIRVGQFLGAGDGKSAKTSATVALSSNCLIQCCLAVLVFSLRYYLPLLFTDSREAGELIIQVIPTLALYILLGGVGGVGAGIMRGQGRQHLGAAVVIISYALALIFGVPLMLYTSLRLNAFWGALTVGISIEGLIYLLLIVRNDWEKLAKQAIERVSNQTITLDGNHEAQGWELPEDENTLLLPENLLQNSENREMDTMPSQALQKHDYGCTLTAVSGGKKKESVNLTSVLLKRILVVLIVLLIFLAGLSLRFF